MFFFVFKQKTAYEMRISDWSSDVCSSDLIGFSNKETGSVSAPRRTVLLADRRRSDIGQLNAVRQTGQDAGQMRGRDGVVRVGAELFGGEFPVAGDDPLLHTRDGFGAGLGTVEHVVHVELRLAQIGEIGRASCRERV